MSEQKRRPVVICTKYRGVFHGWAEDTSGGKVKLTDARMCVYWTQDMKGVFGLAVTGPTEGCRVSQAAPSVELRGVTAVIEMTDEAVKRWEAAPWKA